MAALLLDTDNRPAARLERIPLGIGHDERWLQALLFDHFELIPLDRIDPGAGMVVPVCRELPLPKPGGNVFLDMLGVTQHGRPVLVECKLWRNPHARREVVAQLLEYAALFRRWSYADLTARLKAKMATDAANPLFASVARHFPSAEEARFVDSVARNLRSGDFHLIIAGDGIREDLAAIAEHLGDQGARLALVEFQLWADAAGRTVVVPHLPFKTELIRQRIIVDATGTPLQVGDEADEEVEAAIDVDRSATRAANRAFWDRFIGAVKFDHTDQPPAKHGGNNWVKIPMPTPGRWLTAYRYGPNPDLGFFLVWEKEQPVYDYLTQEADALREETGLPDLRFHRLGRPEAKDSIGLNRAASCIGGEAEQIAWLAETANRLVNALRPRLAAIGNG